MTHIGSLLPLPLLSLVLLSASALDSSVYTYRDIFTRGFRTAVHNPQAHDYVKQVHEHNPQVYNNYVTQVHDHNSQVQGRDSIVYDHNHQVLEHNPQVYDYFTQGYDRNPQVQERDSVVYDHNPQVIELNPPVHDHNPQVHDHNPQVHDHNPQVLEHKPQVHDHNPRIHDHNPLVYDHNPQVHDHNPQVGAHNPQVHIHDKNPRSENDQSVFNIPLDPAGLAEMFWSLDYLNKEVAIEVHAYLKPTQWMAVGFSDYGKLSHADLCMYWIDWKRKARMQDANSDKDCKLMEDEHQDCKNFRVMKQGNITKFMFVRKFDTCDNQDYVIEEGTTHIVYSIGDGPLFSINGVNIAATKHNGMQRTQLLKNINAHVPLPKSAWSFDVVANKVKVPNAETTYWCHIVELSSKLKKRHHVVQFESVIQKGNEPLVHHIEVFQCVADPDKTIPHYSGPCTGPNRPNATQVCKKVIAAWAMGATPFSYPKEAGLPIGGSDFNRFVMLEVHYNNPNKKDDYVDSSGVRVHVTDELRENDAGVIELGLEYIDKMAIPPRQKVFPLSGYCIAECTGISLPPEGIVIFGSQLHTHLTGVRVFTKHVRDGKELKELNRDNHYSTHFQEIRVLKEPRTLLPGDALITTCWYNTEDRANITVGGFAISDEMCVNYIYYYPKLNLEVCKSSISDENLINYFKLMNELESQPTSPKLGITDNYKSIEWNPIRVRVLDELYHQSPIYMQCNQSSGLRFPGDWSRVPLTRISEHLPIPERDCA